MRSNCIQVVCLVAGLFLVGGTVRAADGAPPKPNIIFIVADDLGWADLGCQGVRSDVKTPHLDALAAGGVRATNGYVTAPQCVPSRAGLITGRYQNRFGVEDNQDELDGFNRQTTLPTRLKKAGYVTGMSGKWHLGPVQEIVKHGFDEVYCTQSAVGLNLRGWANVDADGKPIKGQAVNIQGEYHLEVNASAACAFIQRHAQQPFFYYLAFRGPHTPLDAPEKYTARFPGPMPERRRMGLAALSAIDDGVGRVMAALRSQGLEEKTLIFFMGDNGAPLKLTMPDLPFEGDNAHDGGWDGSLNAPMNGEKGMLTEGGIREPWLAHWKGTLPAGLVYEHPVISLDVAATALELAGLNTGPELDGINLLPHLTGKIKDAPQRDLYWRWIAQAAIRSGKWKLLVAGTRSYLFDLSSDPGETRNLIAAHPDVARDLRTRLERWGGALQPPGIGTAELGRWSAAFDYFLDGKAPAPPAPGKKKAPASAERAE